MSAILSTKGDYLRQVSDALTAVEQELARLFDCQLTTAELVALHPQVEEHLAQVVELSVDTLNYLSPTEALALAEEARVTKMTRIIEARKNILDARAHALFARANDLHDRSTCTWRRRLREGC